MPTDLGVSAIVGPLKPLAGLIPGWKTSEAQLTAAAGGLLALAQAAEGLGLIHPGAASGLWPMAAMVGLYVLSRTVLKARTPPPVDASAGPQPAAPTPSDAALPDPLAEVMAKALEAAQQQALSDVQAKLLDALGGQIIPRKEPQEQEK